MSPEKERALTKRFPLLFRGRYLSLRVNLMPFGCECSDGWYNLIYLACLGLEDEINKLYPWWYRKLYTPIKLIEQTWNNLMWKLPKSLQRKYTFGHCARFLIRFRDIPLFTQIKEKYGTLCLYMSASSDTMHTYTSIAENASSSTCEQCGNYGSTKGKFWLYTACDEHTKEEDKDQEEVVE